ncbi:uncharacterized protein LOC116868837 [Lontra canadensis]|uniref:uncharacterized protein LOC116868837 n=1 Tax=Lontra canadensis TaxID=76717 RepID=UPI0013F389A3|nr:uncharacterized protein LOC116868837 [Lontra canadensis]
MPGLRKGKAREWGARASRRAQRRPSAEVPGQLVPAALLFALISLTPALPACLLRKLLASPSPLSFANFPETPLNLAGESFRPPTPDPLSPAPRISKRGSSDVYLPFSRGVAPGRRGGRKWGHWGGFRAGPQRPGGIHVKGSVSKAPGTVALTPVTGRAERDPLPTSRPRARPPGRAAAAAAAAAARLRGIPPDLPLPLRLTLPCLAPVLDRRFPIYTTLGSSRLTLPSCSRWTLTSLELPPSAGPPPPPAPKDLGFLKHLPESLPLSGPGHTSLSLSPLRCLAPPPPIFSCSPSFLFSSFAFPPHLLISCNRSFILYERLPGN